MTLLMLKVVRFLVQIIMKNNAMLYDIHCEQYAQRYTMKDHEEQYDFRNRGHDLQWELQQEIEKLDPNYRA